MGRGAWKRERERRTQVSTTTLGIIGTGMVGAGVARRAVDAGLDVVLSNSRGPRSLAGLVAELGERARAATPAEAASAGDLVLASVPLVAHDRLPRAELAGKTVIDPMNYALIPGWSFPELDSDELTSSELVQRHLAGARVVKALHNIGPKQLLSLFRPAGAPDRTALPLSGDDPGAKKEVADLLDVLGFDTVDLGSLADSWRSEPNTPLYALPYVGQPPTGLAPTDLVAWFQQAPGVPVSVARIKELAASAVRGPAGFRMQ
ncbi:NAD(P)-binding domain-containing protein [Streptomyces sp. KK5PA1]|uniref:NAD(P)-binding domain-containing protein n=2 Tax=Actinacidiphila acididurans TaxID=2784346 RepID=A0ABS2TS89_9ACTN|nr:NAD(P)-binding domain-containing protein [Actinacidiphila acididurans]